MAKIKKRPKKLFTLAEAARELSLDRTEVRHLVQRGYLSTEHSGRRLVIPARDIALHQYRAIARETIDDALLREVYVLDRHGAKVTDYQDITHHHITMLDVAREGYELEREAIFKKAEVSPVNAAKALLISEVMARLRTRDSRLVRALPVPHYLTQGCDSFQITLFDDESFKDFLGIGDLRTHFLTLEEVAKELGIRYSSAKQLTRGYGLGRNIGTSERPHYLFNHQAKMVLEHLAKNGTKSS